MRLTKLLTLLLMMACGPAKPTTGDRTVDTSCGLDCVAQKRFGLIVDRCFEYSASDTTKQDPPELGAFVKPVFTLEGGVQVLPVEYRRTGQTLMIDNFAFKDGALLLMRREFPRQGKSVTFKNEAGAIVGVTWLTADPLPGQTQTTSVQANIVESSGAGTSEATRYQVSTAQANAGQLKTPLSNVTDGLRLLTTQSPDRGADPIRVFVPETGFISITSPLSATPANPTPIFLQKVRDLTAGEPACSVGVP